MKINIHVKEEEQAYLSTCVSPYGVIEVATEHPLDALACMLVGASFSNDKDEEEEEERTPPPMLSRIELAEILQTTEEIALSHHDQQKHGGDWKECMWYECMTLRANARKLRALKPYLPDTILDGVLQDTLEKFESRLRVNQEPLGKEFEKVLHENLDTLLVYDAPLEAKK